MTNKDSLSANSATSSAPSASSGLASSHSASSAQAGLASSNATSSVQAGLAGNVLRQKAEAHARTRATRTPKGIAAISPEETLHSLHELRVHQIELEMQNEELRRAQAENEAGRERYLDLYDLAPVGYITLSEKGLILEANLTAATLLGTNRGGLIMMPISRFILKDDQDIYYLLRKKLFETHSTPSVRSTSSVQAGQEGLAHSTSSGLAGQPQECAVRLVKPDGTFIWTHLTATAAQAEDGTPVCRMALTDITERKKAEEALQTRESRFRGLVEQGVTGITVLDPTGTVIYDVPTAQVSTRFTPEEMHGKNIFTLVHPDDLIRVETAFRRLLKRPGKSETLDLRVLSKDGSYRHLHVTGTNQLRNPAIGGLVINSLDITDRKNAETALADEHNLYMDLVKSLPAGVYRLHIESQKPWKQREWVGKVESNYRLEVMSNSFCQILGTTRQKIEANAATVVDCLHPDDRPDFVRRNVVALETMQPFEWEGRVNRPGPTRWVRFLSVPRSKPNGDVIWTGVLLDTTEVRRAVESLQKSRDELEDKVRERTARLRSLAAQLTRAEHAERRRIAHLLHEDLQQRLAAILYKVNDIKGAIQDAAALQTTDMALHELAEAVELTRNLTTRLAPPALYQLGVRPALETLARDMKAQFSLSVSITGLQTFRLPSDDMRDFAFDAARELLLNVTKHAGVKSAEIRIRSAGKKRIAVEVRDKGKGMARKGEHTEGFGLFSIRERAEAMGIGFDISSRPGRGTCVALSLPIL